jgi:hypothetical protein
MEDADYVWTNNPATFTIAPCKMGNSLLALSYMAELANPRHGSSKFNIDFTPESKSHNGTYYDQKSKAIDIHRTFGT